MPLFGLSETFFYFGLFLGDVVFLDLVIEKGKVGAVSQVLLDQFSQLFGGVVVDLLLKETTVHHLQLLLRLAVELEGCEVVENEVLGCLHTFTSDLN